MSARYVSSKFIRNVTQGSKSIAVEYVDKTTVWTRPADFPTTTTKEQFAQVVEENANALAPDTVRVAMKESEHQSDEDKRIHYTGYELDKNENVVKASHFVQQK